MRHAALKFYRVLRGGRGFSIVETVFAAAALSIIALGAGSLALVGQSSSSKLRAARVAMSGRVTIESALKDPTAWQQTLTQNPSLYCGTIAPGCAAPVGADGYNSFTIYSAEVGQKVSYDPLTPSSRLNIRGGACPAGENNPSDNCPIKFIAKWKPLCVAFPCMNPSLEIKVVLVTEFAGGAKPLNAANYEYTVVRPAGEDPLQSACFVLNGTYNVSGGICVPKYSGKTCAALGKPYEIITGVHEDGTIDCSPLYKGMCNVATQVLGGTANDGNAQCQAKVLGSCAVNCVGVWGACSSNTCVPGTQNYNIITPPANGGAACPFANGASQACGLGPCQVDCVGSWGACTQACGGGTKTFTVTTSAANGGVSCVANNGDSVICNSQACGVPADCTGNWGACNTGTGLSDFNVTQLPQNGGAACPVSPQTCPVDCAGGWSACTAGVKTYTWTTTPKNGGAVCPYANGQTDPLPCPPQTCKWQLTVVASDKFINLAKLIGTSVVMEAGACAVDTPDCGGDFCGDVIGTNCGVDGQTSTCFNLGPGPCCGVGIPCPCTAKPVRCKCL